MVYPGHGTGMLTGTDQSHGKARSSYDDYVALRTRIAAFGLKLVACENGYRSRIFAQG